MTNSTAKSLQYISIALMSTAQNEKTESSPYAYFEMKQLLICRLASATLTDVAFGPRDDVFPVRLPSAFCVSVRSQSVAESRHAVFDFLETSTSSGAMGAVQLTTG
ncbi:hypothetical protein MRX96_005458 [Rhipicephalus microplus]